MKILGIDPAWAIEKNPSGIACVEGNLADGWKWKWKCTGLYKSIDHFFHDWDIRIPWTKDDFLVKILEKLGKVDCIVVDMPLSHGPVKGRRYADNEISRVFGKYHCSTHSAPEYAYNIGASLLKQALNYGYSLNHNIIETFPHPAILRLIPNLTDRLQYKVNKATCYWPEKTFSERLTELKGNMNVLKNAIQREIKLPDDFVFDSISVKSKLKPYEDMLDALVCAWVGIVFKTSPKSIEKYGDDNGAIWVPNFVKLNQKLCPTP